VWTSTGARRGRSTAQVHAEAERKKEEIRERAERELAAELERQAATEEERERLRADLVKQETERKAASQRKRALAAKLKGMENKLLKGGALAASRRVETRVHQTRSGLVSVPISSRFGPRRAVRACQSARPRRRRRCGRMRAYAFREGLVSRRRRSRAGQLLDKAATQEAELRKAKQELTRKQEAERRMANEMRAPARTSTSTPSSRRRTCDSHAGASRRPRRPRPKKSSAL
jgi:hypothetical protein